ncbi:MAG: CidA/LrgA family protein [Oscillospiraceae bacterium]|nr:CidA/LrgA family protein [Oscillospiraceae bacterium]
MKYVMQFALILAVSFVGEILNFLIPLPIPASIYGIIILFLCLEFKIIKLSWVKDVGTFLIAAMPVMFIPAGVGLMASWNILRPSIVAYAVITLVTTVVVMAASGLATQLVIKLRNRGEGKKNG